MADVDALAAAVFAADNSSEPPEYVAKDWATITEARGSHTYAHNIARGLIAAGYRKAEHDA